MQTSRFHLSLSIALAAALGYALSSSQAVGYPSGAAISTGTNPVWSTSGAASSGTTMVVLTAPADQDMVVTDVHLGTTYSSYYCGVLFQRPSGEEIGRIRMSSLHSYGFTGYANSFNSGMRVPAGEALTMELSGCPSSMNADYMLSGYYAQP